MAGSSIAKDIAAPPERVWQVITDLDGSPDVMSAITAVERIDGGPGFDVGTRWRETRTMFGREATEEMEVTAIDPGRSYTVEAESTGARYVSTFLVEAHESGSRLTMSFSGTPKGIVGRMLAATVGRLLAGTTTKAIQQDLEDIAAAAEAG